MYSPLVSTETKFYILILNRNQTRRRQCHPTPGKSHGRRSLVGCSPWGLEELDMTEWLHFRFSLACIGEGNGNPLQCSCLENLRDGGAWWAAVCGVTQSRTRLKRLSSSSSRAEELMLLNCGVGEDSWESLGQQGDQTCQSCSMLSFLPTIPPLWCFLMPTCAHRHSRMFSSVQFIQLCLTLCDPMDCSTPGFPVHHQLPELAKTQVHWVGDAIQPSHPLSSPSPPAFNLFQHQGLFHWVSSSHQVARNIGVSASASVLPMNIQDWFPSGWTGWIWTELLAITKMWKQLKCPSADNWLKKWCHTHLCTQT